MSNKLAYTLFFMVAVAIFLLGVELNRIDYQIYQLNQEAKKKKPDICLYWEYKNHISGKTKYVKAWADDWITIEAHRKVHNKDFDHVGECYE